MLRKYVKPLILLTVFMLLLTAGCARRQEKEPENKGAPSEEQQETKAKIGMVTDVGGLGDQSFNDAAYRGLQQAEEELNAEIKVVESQDMTAYVPNLSSLADQDYDLIWAIGVLMQDALTEVAQDLPDSNFGIIDAVIDAENVYSATFAEEEGSFLAGIVAGMMTESNKVGFIGGMELDTIIKFEAGYAAGVKAINPDATLTVAYTGAFDDPNRGKEQATTMYGQGVDVIYHASGACGVGVINAAKERDKYAIGVDSPQSHLAPEHVLTSMIKKVDLAVYEAAQGLIEKNEFPGGIHKVYTLKEDGVGLEMDQLKKMTPSEVQDKVEEMRQKIIAGEIDVPETRDEVENFTL